MVKNKPQKFNLKQAFLGLQKEMTLKLGNARITVGHPVAKGDVTEGSWRSMLQTYLPKRYAVEKAFVVASDGNISDQIDLVIFDRHFSPFLIHQDGAYYIPAESVYAVFEIKQEATKKELVYAGEKAKSVRKLHRTSTHIIHIGGRNEPVAPKPIIAGFLCLNSSWKDGLKGKLASIATSMSGDEKLDLICVLESGALSLGTDATGKSTIQLFPPEQALIQFFFALLVKLQSIGSVPAIDIHAYGKSLKP